MMIPLRTLSRLPSSSRTSSTFISTRQFSSTSLLFNANQSKPSSSKPDRPKDSRPFRKQYPPPKPSPPPVTFDKPAVANPIETAQAHRDFNRKFKIVGISLVLLAGVSGIAWYAFGLGKTIHNQESKEEGQPVAVGDGLEIKGMENVDREELEMKIREAQKNQHGNYALLAVQR